MFSDKLLRCIKCTYFDNILRVKEKGGKYFLRLGLGLGLDLLYTSWFNSSMEPNAHTNNGLRVVYTPCRA